MGNEVATIYIEFQLIVIYACPLLVVHYNIALRVGLG